MRSVVAERLHDYAQRPFVAHLILEAHKSATRVMAFFRKEVMEIWRQPLLLASLVGGPFLVLLIFGVTYQQANPELRTVLVVPPGGLGSLDENRIRSMVSTNFTLVGMASDAASVEPLLRAGKVDVVQVIPAQAQEDVLEGRRPTLEFISAAINPLDEGWIQYLAYAEVTEINRALLQRQAIQVQQEALGLQSNLVEAQSMLDELRGSVSPERLRNIQRSLRGLDILLAIVQSQLPAPDPVTDRVRPDIAQLRERVASLRANMEFIDEAISSGSIQLQVERIDAALNELATLRTGLQDFVSLSPDLLVSPIQQRYTNLRGKAYAAAVYYAPSVLALLIQHLAVTLGALSLVRERLKGSTEIFRVAPVNVVEILLGKYLAYALVISLAALALAFLTSFLGVPAPVRPDLFMALVLLVTLASLGIGFVVSAVSRSDSQAIQLSMLLLLLAIFFGGIFIPLASFAPAARILSYTLPITHGLQGFQDLTLRGTLPDPLTWAGLIGIALFSFGLVVLLTEREYRRGM